MEIEPRSVVLAMGCRERTRHQVMIPGLPARGGHHAREPRSAT